MSDVDEQFHETWLGLVQPTVGLVVSLPVLVEAQCAEHLVPDAHARLRAICSQTADGDVSCDDARRLCHELLGYPHDAVGDGLEQHALFVADGPQVLRPSFVLRAPDAPEQAMVLVWQVPDALDLDKPETVTGAFEHPASAKFDRMLRHAQVPIGLLTNGREVRLVYAPSGEASGSITFRVADMLTVGGRPILDAFVMLLAAHRLYGVGPERTLPRILEDSRRWQARASERLADQVLEAATILLDGLQEAALRDADRQLFELAAADGDQVHRGVLTALLRIVFLLYAEDGGLMPFEDELYARSLSVVELYARLRSDAGAYPDVMGARFGAWGHLVSASRAVFFGVSCGALRLPPRRGALFDPTRFPFLEGWESGGAPVADAEARATTRVPTVSDATVLVVLERLMVIGGQRISYRALDVEQIGSVYERMLGYTIVRLPDYAVCVRGSRTWVTVSELADVAAARRARWLKEAGVPATVAERTARVFNEARSEEEKRAALTLAAQKLAHGPLARPAGTLALQSRTSNESSTSHYTPRSLCGPLVARALEPVMRSLGPEPSAEQILSLKVCDPAMGSGAFLVEACRFLADHVVAAWKREPTLRPEGARAEDPVVVARRVVAQRCLYGVDRNADAVELAKLSLWLVTLARDLPFTFVDHALRHGDSIVGLSADAVARFHWKEDDASDASFRDEVDSVLAETLPLRAEIEALASSDSPEEQMRKARLLWDVEDALERLRVVADLVLAAYVGSDTATAREALRIRYRDAVAAWLRDDAPLPPDVLSARVAFRAGTPAFHWELEFPEIFHEHRHDPLADERLEAGGVNAGRMDTFIGNMPFIGGRRIATVHGERYAAWLCHAYEASGEVDYVTYFFRRTNDLLGSNGTIGLIATSSIAQGDTRRAGLQRLLAEGLVIYDATSKMPWPGEANVLVAPVLLAKGTMRAHVGSSTLNGTVVARINSRLRSYAERDDPERLDANRGCAFVGCFLRGEGFVLSTEEAGAVLKDQPNEAPVIRRYLVGEDVAKHPSQHASRFVVDFANMDLVGAQRFPRSLAILEERVRPDRERLKTTGADASHRRYWWRFANTRTDLRTWLANNEECLVLPRVAKHLLIARVPADQVFSEQVVVFGLTGASAFGVLQSRIHEVWVRLLSSTMGEGLRYSASDCFDTFPFPTADPRATLPGVDVAARRLDVLRAEYMHAEGVGLTVTYNRLRDPALDDPAVRGLRRAHEDNEAAVIAAYAAHDPEGAWQGIVVPPFCCTGSAEEVEAFEDAVIDRLFALNGRRASSEKAAGRASDDAPPTGRRRARKTRTA